MSAAADEVVVEVSDQVATITLNRPERRNAFTARMGRLLGEAYRSCDADDGVRAVIVTGAPPAFCAGADLAAGGETFARPADPGFTAAPVDPPAWAVRKPVIAAMNGHAIGIGLTLALQADLRIVASGARYGIVQARRGVVGDAMSHWVLPRLVGVATAADLLLTARMVEGDEAAALGLASRCVAAHEVLATAKAIAADIVEHVAPLSAAISKRLLWEGLGALPAEVERLETLMHRHLMGSEDAREGVLAFLDRRAPSWTSRVSRDWPEWPGG